MGRDLFDKTALGRQLYKKANKIMGMDIASLSFNGPSEALMRTEYTQPSIFIVSVILANLLMERGGVPHCGAGHSLGEYSALTAAAVFSFEDALKLVKIRGQSMQDSGTSNPGTMAAIIGLDEEKVSRICEESSGEGVVAPANFNSQNQIVISGDLKSVRHAIELAKEAGAARAIELKVSGAFHSPLMSSAKKAVREALENIELREARFPVVMNVTARRTTDPDEIRRNLIDQIDHPVRWLETIQELKDLRVTQCIEVGPGNVLRGLLRRIDSFFSASGVESLETLEKVACA